MATSHDPGTAPSSGPASDPQPEGPESDKTTSVPSPVVIRGTVANDLDLRSTDSGRSFVNVRVAAYQMEQGGTRVDITEDNKWHQATFWNEKAEQAVAELAKGSKIELTGNQKIVSYEKDDATRTASEIRNPVYTVRSIELKGMVAKDPELHVTDNGTVIGRVLVAADDVRKAGQKLSPEENKWHQAVFFGERAKAVTSELKKGMVVHLAGEHQVRSYDDKDGTARTASEIISPKVDIRSLEIEGTVARDPEVSYTQAGKPFTRVSIAADRVTRGNEALNPDENKWHSAICWGDKALAAAESYKKGMDVRVSGEQRIAQYEGRDGRQHISSELHMPKIEPFQRERAQDRSLTR
jgi:single-strand DNA-binding protein